MQTLSLDKAHLYVVQALDELKSLEGSTMLGTDELDTKKLVDGYIVEAALKSHKDAPSYLLDGETQESDYKAEIQTDLSVKVTMQTESARLVSFKASDSPVVVTDYAPEESPIGRMQNNKYVRGTYDDPRLIVKKVWTADKKPEYVYYSVKEKTETGPTFTLEHIPYPQIVNGSVEISDKMEYAVLNLLVSMVLDALSLHDKATLYRNKYQEYLQTAR
jgi:hypothetical protein